MSQACTPCGGDTPLPVLLSQIMASATPYCPPAPAPDSGDSTDGAVPTLEVMDLPVGRTTLFHGLGTEDIQLTVLHDGQEVLVAYQTRGPHYVDIDAYAAYAAATVSISRLLPPSGAGAFADYLISVNLAAGANIITHGLDTTDLRVGVQWQGRPLLVAYRATDDNSITLTARAAYAGARLFIHRLAQP